MIRSYSKSGLQKKYILIAFMILTSFCLFENAFSLKPWNRESISVSYNKTKNAISIKFEFIDYEFGDCGEHAYLQQMVFGYLASEGSYQPLMKCVVEDQLKDGISTIYMKSKLSSATLEFFGSPDQTEGNKWTGIEESILVHNTSSKGILTVVWLLAPEQIVKSIFVSGKWQIEGLICSQEIFGQVYQVPYEPPVNTKVQTVLKQKQLIDKNEDQAVKNNLKVYKEADSVVIKGADLEENINVYSTAGLLINSTISKDEAVKIKLSTNQIYVVQIGQSCHKIVM